MNKLYMVEMIRYEKPVNATVVRFYRKGTETVEHRNPSERALARVAMAVHKGDFRIRPFLAGEVGWVAEKVT